MHRHMLKIWILSVLVLIVTFLFGLGTNRIITVMQENTPIRNRKIVVIDAGHGGEDGGASSATGVLESTVNLQMAKRLNDICHLIGIETVMIRDTDTSVYTTGKTLAQKKVSDLKNRVERINSLENQILISIHQNYYTDNRYTGAQVFYSPAEGSRQLAEFLQEELIRTVNTQNNRNVKAADGIYLMQNIQCPGVLVECGFLSNPAEAAKLTQPDYQKQLCCVIASVCSQHLHRDKTLA